MSMLQGIGRIDLFYFKDNEYTHTARLDRVCAKTLTTSSHSAMVANNEKEIPKSVLTKAEFDEWCRIEPKEGETSFSMGYDEDEDDY